MFDQIFAPNFNQFKIISYKKLYKSQYMPIHSILILILIAHYMYLFIYTVTHINNSRKFAKKWKYFHFLLFLHWEEESAGLLKLDFNICFYSYNYIHHTKQGYLSQPPFDVSKSKHPYFFQNINITE